MIFELKGNVNYSAVIVKIEKLAPLGNCDNIQQAFLFGNSVIVSKECKIDDVGIYFPVECSINKEFLRVNNLYRDSTLNADQTKKGFFELNGRVRCVKLRGNKSEGFFIPIESIYFLINEYLPYSNNIKKLEIEIGKQFDHINDIKLCEKYIIQRRQPSQGGPKKGKKAKVSRIVKDQFKFHQDTEKLERNIDRLFPDSFISLSAKFHGTSAIFSNILCYKKLNIFQKMLLGLGVMLETKYFDNIYASRKVIKNSDLCENPNGFYSEDIWGKANSVIKEHLQKNMTIYAEVVGYVSEDKYIQKSYDYGCKNGGFDVYIYRITFTNEDGIVFEMPFTQMVQWCKGKGLKSVIPYYVGYAKDLYQNIATDNIDEWRNCFLEKLKNDKNFNMEKNCPYCITNKVPFEGLVLRIEGLGFEAYKIKCYNFLEAETKSKDKGESDIEEEQV